MGGLRSKSTFLFLTVFLLFVIFSAARIGVAEKFSGRARYAMHTWSTGKAQADPSSEATVSRELDLARLFAPDNPDNIEDQARLALIRASLPGLSESERNTLLAQGIKQIHEAIALRPVSSYSWATLLMLKRERAEYDAEFRLALERAVTLGPWEPEVQLIVADVGSSAWTALPRAEQDMLQKNFVRGLKRQAKEILAIAQSHQDDCNSTRARLNAGCSR